MSSTEVTPLPLPDVELNPQTTSSFKTEYKAGETTLVDTVIDGQEETVAVKFDAARLIRISGRVQAAGRGTNRRKMLVVTMNIVLDGLQVGLVGENDNVVPHPLLSGEPRYANYSQLGHRINAQQWMETHDHVHVIDLINHLQAKHKFRAQRRPAQRNNSQRRTRDLFQARPIEPYDPDNPTARGVKLDYFEVSVNEEYESGFDSFYTGLNEQLERWTNAVTEEDEQLRKQMEESLARNMHFVSGVYFEDSTQEWWPRPVDVGIVGVDDQRFALYPENGRALNAADISSDIASDPGGVSETSSEDLTGPTAADLQDF